GAGGLFEVPAGRRRLAVEEKGLGTEAAAILAFVGLAHRRREVASALPYGEQRLVELAVALAARPRVLLLDEPGAGMTGAEKTMVSGLIRKIREQGVTVLLVEHDMRMVMGVSDNRIAINGGRVLAERRPVVGRSRACCIPTASARDPSLSRSLAWPRLTRLRCCAWITCTRGTGRSRRCAGWTWWWRRASSCA